MNLRVPPFLISVFNILPEMYEFLPLARRFPRPPPPDRSFQVGFRKPVFSSPMATNYLTTGRWSPTRPGMLFLGKVDGSMDVWDFTDSSYTPSVTLMSSPSRITRWEPSRKQPCLTPRAKTGAIKKPHILSPSLTLFLPYPCPENKHRATLCTLNASVFRPWHIKYAPFTRGV